MDTSMYIVTHKKFKVPSLNNYIPIEVGAELRNEELGYIKDNTGDNISIKNKNYCELTGIYWIWKNDKHSDAIGICHYRRFFSRYLFDVSQRYFLQVKDIDNLLKKYDMILPVKYFWIKHDVASGYYEAGQGIKKDLDTTADVIRDLYPEYCDTLKKVLVSKEASYCNMLICKRDLFNRYCEWLFAILFEVEKRTDISNYSDAEARIYGYLSEILLNVWIQYNHLNVKHYNVIVDKPLTKKRKPFAYIEKFPLIKYFAKILLCMDLNSIRSKKCK